MLIYNNHNSINGGIRAPFKEYRQEGLGGVAGGDSAGVDCCDVPEAVGGGRVQFVVPLASRLHIGRTGRNIQYAVAPEDVLSAPVVREGEGGGFDVAGEDRGVEINCGQGAARYIQILADVREGVMEMITILILMIRSYFFYDVF